ncbi:uncharacterized protein LOC143058010 [Mytilus galloprovincialis]|uniref:uncharacterized protein LOC143058010 n=1 Tax=Mytilus galloprovincialis TaxID=29158 RepID=UPI003F7B69C4
MARSYIYRTAIIYTSIATVVANVSLIFRPEIIRLGETLSLICTVSGVNNIDGGLIRQWTKGPELICYNGHPINSDKYTEILKNGNQFELQINNVTESDLRCKYQCRYSFDTQTKGIEISKHNFEYLPSSDTRAIMQETSDGSIKIHLHLKKVYPMPNCTVAKQGLHIPFNIVKHHRHGIYYEVIMAYQAEKSTNCNDNLEVICQLIDKHPIPVDNEMMCQVKDELMTYTIISICVSICVSLTVATLLLYRKLRNKSVNKEVHL